MRLFIGVFMPEEVHEGIKKAQKELERQKLFRADYSGTENLHLTLKFLGEVDEEKAKKVAEKLREIKHPKIMSKLEKAGAFDRKHLKIIWIKTPGFEQLQRMIDEKLKELMIPGEERFMGHLTIARVKDYHRGKEEGIIKEIEKIRLGEEFKATEFCLIKSILKPEGPEYKIIEKFKLG